MIGEWSFYNNSGKIVKTISYDYKLIINESTSNTTNDNESPPSMLSVEEMPKFQNSTNLQDFSNYVADNIIFPPMAAKIGIQGKVFLKFVINEKGQVSDIKVIKKINKDIDQEAIRVLAQSPVWIPGYQKGKLVKVNYVIPINFEFN